MRTLIAVCLMCGALPAAEPPVIAPTIEPQQLGGQLVAVGKPVILGRGEFEFFALTKSVGSITWDVSSATEPSPIVLIEVAPKTPVVGFRSGHPEPASHLSPDGPCVAVFAVGTGDATLTAWGVKGTKPTKLATMLVRCGNGPRPPPEPKPHPQPDPEPKPDPIVKPITLGLIVFADVADRKPDTAKLLLSRYWQEISKRHRVAVYDRATNENVGKAFLAETVGATGPTLLIRDDAASQKLAVIPLPKTEADFEAAIKAWSSK